MTKLKERLRSTRRLGVAPLLLAVVLVVVVIVAGVGVYVFVLSASGTSGKTSTTTLGPTESSVTTSASQSGQNYKGSFTYANPLGPFGINDSSGKPVEWNSTQSATGTFTFSIDPATYIGTGVGSGSITVSTQGYCTGSTTVQYTFNITATHVPGENFVISFNTPTPPSVTVQLTCQGSTDGFYTSNNPVTYLSVYPNGLSMSAVPYTTSQPPTAGISYTVTVENA